MQNEFDYGQTHADEVICKPAASNGGELAEAEISNTGSVQSIAQKAGANYVLARDIQLDPSLHESRAFSDDDLAGAGAVVAHEHLVAPFPVVERGNQLILLDGFVTLQAVIARDPDARVKVVRVDDAIARAAASCGVHLQRVFADIGPTGSSQSELEHLVKAAESGGVSAIVVANKARLSRSIAALRRLEERFSAAGIEIINAER